MALPAALTDLLARHAHLQVHCVEAALGPQTLAQDLAERLQQAMAARGRAILGVSGGRSPLALFQALSQQAVTWPRVHVTQVDERYVARDHEASNASLVQTHLLQGQAAQAQWRPLVPQEHGPLPTLDTLVDAADNALRELGPADVLVLGMGNDGHTASIFPDSDRLAASLDPHTPRACLGLTPRPLPGDAPYARLTQTMAQILRARHLAIALAGSAKLTTLQQALVERSDHLPISHVLHQTATPVSLWITP